jgi:hypothetical protein
LIDYGPVLCGLAIVAGDDVSIEFTANVDLSLYAPSAAVVNRTSRIVLQAFTVVDGGDWDGVQSSMKLEIAAADSLLLAGRSMDWWMEFTDPVTGDVRTVLSGSFTARHQ